mgnify:CR=1 FL=1
MLISFFFLFFFFLFFFFLPINRCVDKYIDRNSCENANPDWNWKYFTRSHNETECAQKGRGFLTRSSQTTGILEKNCTAEKDKCNCNCTEPFFEWNLGTWVSGKMAKTEWVPRRYEGVTEVKPALNFRKIADDVVIQEKILLQSQIQNLVCDCVGNGK